MLEIKEGDNRLGIYPKLGGSIAFWLRRNVPIFYPIVNSHLTMQSNQIIAAYPLLPYSNRIAGGQFDFANHHYQLLSNASNGRDAIHGNAWQKEWSLEMLAKNSVTLSLHHQPVDELAKEWPFSYYAQVNYTLSREGLMVSLYFKNTDHDNQPVGLGFHPYFPCRNKVELGFAAQSVWNNDENGLPQGRMSIKGRWDFAKMKELQNSESLDNCYAGWNQIAFMRWLYSDIYLTMTASSIFQHLVLFTPQNQSYFTLEPATNMNNAINMSEISDRGLTILRPGESVEGKINYVFTGF
ncbi:putative protein YphB [Commensalibacter sp. Nvir]|uniref:aldose 1-epimerase n=1 Tax=Commensalibacter sp. Nvir TaxID=3069817 RepID=UPI002D443C92|nr:putative protein YphB [Commensalibacter sp. Nvir]